MATAADRPSNISSASQRQMMRVSLVFFTVALVASAVLVRADVATELRLLVLVPFFLSWLNLYQALFKT